MPIAESELVLNEDGSVYHLGLHPEDIADLIIIVGDQGRVPLVASFFEEVEIEKSNREYHTITGRVNGKRITAMSTGMGPDNIEILMNELDALVNIDLSSREIKQEHKSLKIVRIGTCGGLHPNAIADSWIVTEKAIGLDNVLQYYGFDPNGTFQGLIEAFYAHTNWPKTAIPVYASSASQELLEVLKDGCQVGITATAPGFYGPQGRSLRIPSVLPDLEESLSSFSYNGLDLLNFEMETSALYGLGELLGHQCCTLCTVIANRSAQSFSYNYKESIKGLISHTINRLTA